jgi:hypothetical protein
MKRLTLVRHAKSDWSLAGQPDWERPLNARGLKDAPDMGRRLRERKLKPDCILTSPAARALGTADETDFEIMLAVGQNHGDGRLRRRGFKGGGQVRAVLQRGANLVDGNHGASLGCRRGTQRLSVRSRPHSAVITSAPKSPMTAVLPGPKTKVASSITLIPLKIAG